MTTAASSFVLPMMHNTGRLHQPRGTGAFVTCSRYSTSPRWVGWYQRRLSRRQQYNSIATHPQRSQRRLIAVAGSPTPTPPKASYDVNWGQLAGLYRNQIIILGFSIFQNNTLQAVDFTKVLSQFTNPELVGLGLLGGVPLLAIGYLIDTSDNPVAASVAADTNALTLRIFGGRRNLVTVGLGAGFLCLLTGIAEETGFRGLVLPALSERLGGNITGGLLSSSLLFGLAHFSGSFAIETLATTALLTFCGAYFGLLYITSGSLVVPMLAHFVYDFGSMFGAHLTVTDRIRFVSNSMNQPNWGILNDPPDVRRRVSQIQRKYGLDDDFVKFSRATFYTMDIDKNGTLDQMEVRIGLAALGRKCSKGQMQELFGDFDEDDNQVLDFAEFLNLVLQLEQRPETLYRGLVGF